MTENGQSALEDSHSGISVQKLHLILGHLYLLPWFVRRSLECELPLRPFLDANPQLELGGLPIAPKLTRYGTEPPYLPSLTIGAQTSPSSIEKFVAEHSVPLILKPLFGSQSRGVRKVTSLEAITSAIEEEPMVLQPYVEAPKEYGINVMRVGSRLKIYGLTEVLGRAVWGDGEHCLRALAEEKYDATVAAQVENGAWTPPDGVRVPIQVAVCPGEGACRDVTDQVTPKLRGACERAADQIGLRFGRFDVKAESLEALQDGSFYILEANGSTSLDLTIYDDRYPLSVKIERLRAHWDEFFHQAQSYESTADNNWRLLATLLWFAVSPRKCIASFWDEINNRELAPRA